MTIQMKLVLGLCVLTLAIGCTKKKEDDASETAAYDPEEVSQQVGEFMASIDELGGTGNGSYAALRSHQKSVARYVTDTSLFSSNPVASFLVPQATATACTAVGYGACTQTGPHHSQRERDFGGCTIGIATLTGTSAIDFGGTGNTDCSLSSDADSAYIRPDFTITAGSASLAISHGDDLGLGISRISGTQFMLFNRGIRRVVTVGGATFRDTTAHIEDSAPFTITGAARSGRTITGGPLHVTNNLNEERCSFTPSGLTWGASCNCPVAGSVSGICTDGSTASIAFSSTCGAAVLTHEGEDSAISLDRCY